MENSGLTFTTPTLDVLLNPPMTLDLGESVKTEGGLSGEVTGWNFLDGTQKYFVPSFTEVPGYRVAKTRTGTEGVWRLPKVYNTVHVKYILNTQRNRIYHLTNVMKYITLHFTDTLRQRGIVLKRHCIDR